MVPLAPLPLPSAPVAPLVAPVPPLWRQSQRGQGRWRKKERKQHGSKRDQDPASRWSGFVLSVLGTASFREEPSRVVKPLLASSYDLSLCPARVQGAGWCSDGSRTIPPPPPWIKRSQNCFPLPTDDMASRQLAKHLVVPLRNPKGKDHE